MERWQLQDTQIAKLEEEIEKRNTYRTEQKAINTDTTERLCVFENEVISIRKELSCISIFNNNTINIPHSLDTTTIPSTSFQSYSYTTLDNHVPHLIYL